MPRPLLPGLSPRYTPTMTTILWLLLAAWLAYMAAAMLPHLLTRCPGPGQSEQGTVVFVESIRWLGVRWGLRTARAGLFRAGWRGEFRYWRWHATWMGWLVIPAIRNGPMLHDRAADLAGLLTARRREHPDRPLHVIGYSCGGWVALRAVEMLPPDVKVDSLCLMGAAVSPGRDLSVAGGKVRRPIVVVSSLCDWLIVGLGTTVFGTADRAYVPSMGMLGALGQGRAVRNLRWRPSWILLGHLGGHFSHCAAAFMHKRVAVAMGIGSADGAGGGK
ncbi:MAG: serine aminopeptidase domain-containing protein [Phycisphaerae bacterium]